MLFRKISGVWTAVGMATDSSLEVECDMEETSSPLSNRAKSFKPGRYSWRMSVSRMYSTTDSNTETDSAGEDEIATLKAGDLIYVGFSKRGELFVDEPTSGSFAHWKRFYGQAYIKDVSINAPVNGNANYRVSFQGTGDLIAQPNAHR